MSGELPVEAVYTSDDGAMPPEFFIAPRARTSLSSSQYGKFFICAIIAMAFIYAAVDTLRSAEDPSETMPGVVVCIGAVLFITWRGIASDIIALSLARRAVAIASRLASVQSREVPFASVCPDMDDGAAEDLLRRLLTKKFLRNALINRSKRCLFLPHIAGSEARSVRYVCPQCGGTSMIDPERDSVCAYCGSHIEL